MICVYSSQKQYHNICRLISLSVYVTMIDTNGQKQYLSFGMSGFLVLICKNSPHMLSMWTSTLGGSRVETDCTQVYSKGSTPWLCLERGVFGRLGMMWCSMGLLLELIELSSLHGRKLNFGCLQVLKVLVPWSLLGSPTSC